MLQKETNKYKENLNLNFDWGSKKKALKQDRLPTLEDIWTFNPKFSHGLYTESTRNQMYKCTVVYQVQVTSFFTTFYFYLIPNQNNSSYLSC